MTLIHRSVESTTYNIIASGIQTLVQFARSIILARILAPSEFGVYTFAASFVLLTKALPNFGMGSAILHRARESEGEVAYRVHFTLSVLFSLAWGILVGLVAQLFVDPQNRTIIWVLLITQVIDNMAQTGMIVYAKLVLFRRIAIINVIVTVLGTISALILAYVGAGVWSLISVDITAAMIPIIGFYWIRPIWKPSLGWSPGVVQYLLNFGKRNLVANLLQQFLDNLDNLWTRHFLGDDALGFYSRAFTFATYPRRVLAVPLNSVAASTYAELKGQRKRLSQAFFRVNAFLIRTGFLFSGVLALIAPEFIRIMIGEKWLPMLTAFQLMLIFTLLDPIKVTIANVFLAVGEPEKTIWARLVQLIVMVLGFAIFVKPFGIMGVALSVNLMIVTGVIMLILQAREHVDFSVRKMFLVPTIGLVFGLVCAYFCSNLPGIIGSDWRTGIVKIIIFSVIYLVFLFASERENFSMMTKIYTELRQ
jgi:O-antigen/teichoic acid export membrane protein